MNFKEIFGEAEWIGAPEDSGYIAVRDSFYADTFKKAEITVLGLGRFVLYVNGKRAHDDYFLPLNSFVEQKDSYKLYPDMIFGTRAYPCKFDITNLVHEGINNITVLLGSGCYTGSQTYFGNTQGKMGDPKVCYKIDLGDSVYCSSTKAKYSKYFVEKSEHNAGEILNFADCGMEIVAEDYDDSSWENASLALPLETETYEFSECPTDKLIREIKPTVNALGVYDTSINLTGYPVIISGGGDIDVTVSETLNGDGTLNKKYTHCQYLTFKNTKKGQRLMPLFTWLGFRYFTVKGDAEVECVHQIHADVKVTSTFESNNETLNWLYKTFLHTMLSNMHEGIPSDCPQIERRGYTGDGQVTAPAVFRTLGAKEFYKKWISDIADCQDKNSGMVHNTAPFTRSGGGPGGWGIAIIKVPYEYWKYYGDERPARLIFHEMMHYLDFMENHCDFGLVTRTEPEGAWCLGDWSFPDNQSEIPPAFVNTYFYIKAMQMGAELANVFGHLEYVMILNDRIENHKKALQLAYADNFPKRGLSFLGGVQGAEAFALDIGLGDDLTLKRFIERYEGLDTFDTGIFGTEIVTRLLFKYGRGDIAVKLLTAEEPYGFGAWKKQGATALWESWKAPVRSMSHHMFGSVVASFYDGILGIEQCENSIGYSRVRIHPADIKGLDSVSGSITTPKGVISVSYNRKSDGTLDVKVQVPNGVKIVD
ncbi:MAG: family 78 glycoside hydrolase catalytic domain [Clostridia bacterium]|nr:family 78 glycoside hydrolase catalytic domain [Clostridia bacterium]